MQWRCSPSLLGRKRWSQRIIGFRKIAVRELRNYWRIRFHMWLVCISKSHILKYLYYFLYWELMSDKILPQNSDDYGCWVDYGIKIMFKNSKHQSLKEWYSKSMKKMQGSGGWNGLADAATENLPKIRFAALAQRSSSGIYKPPILGCMMLQMHSPKRTTQF